MPYYIGLSILSSVNRHAGERQKLLSAEARRILSQLADKPIAEDDIAKEEQGRPFVPGRDLDFSISHSWPLAAVSLLSGKNLRTGCDVELVRKRTKIPEIAEEFFSASERDYIMSCESFDETRFYEIWTLKECYIKLKGLQVFDMAKVPSFICDGDFALCGAGELPLTFYLYALSGGGTRSVLATAVEGIDEEPEIRWFSYDSLPCSSIAIINNAPPKALNLSHKLQK